MLFPLTDGNAALNKAEGEARYEQAFHRAEAVLPLRFSKNILGMIGVSAYILADTFFIAQAQGADGIAALNLVLPVYSLIFALGAMLATGAATRFALERHEGKHADGYLAEALTWAGILSVPFILLGIFSARRASCGCLAANRTS